MRLGTCKFVFISDRQYKARSLTNRVSGLGIHSQHNLGTCGLGKRV
jgi:hypothetical protein